MVDIKLYIPEEMFKCMSTFATNISLDLKEAHTVWCKNC